MEIQYSSYALAYQDSYKVWVLLNHIWLTSFEAVAIFVFFVFLHHEIEATTKIVFLTSYSSINIY